MTPSCRQHLARAATITLAVGLLASCSSDAATEADSPLPVEATPSTPVTTESSVTASTDASVATDGPATTAAPDTTAAVETTEPERADDEQAIAATRALFASVTPDVPGCSVAIARNGEVIFSESYGAASFDPTVPLTPEMKFDIGSTSKQFTATGVQLLVDRGLVDWNAPVSTYFPELPAWAADVTVLQLAHHTSGVTDYIATLNDAGTALETKVTNDELLEVIGSVEALEFEPGSTWSYSNSNYVLLGALIERISGGPLSEFIETELFGPAGMQAEWDDGSPIDKQAGSFARADGSGPWTELMWQWPQLGDGGVISNSEQVAVWGSQYFAPTVGSADINTQRVEGAVTVDIGGEDLGTYGLGIFVSEVDGLGQVFSHSGGWEAYATAFAVSPEFKLVATSTCISGEGPTVTNQNLANDLLAAWK
jgi:CubicO group peptidase (beta-lactamase class C family)